MPLFISFGEVALAHDHFYTWPDLIAYCDNEVLGEMASQKMAEIAAAWSETKCLAVAQDTPFVLLVHMLGHHG